MNTNDNQKPEQKPASFLSRLLGQVSWSSPPWLQRLKSKPGRLSGLFIMLLALISAIIFAYQWYEHLPKPELIKASITAPAITPLTETLEPFPLVIDFGFPGEQAGEFNPQAVAPINLIGKDLTTGIELSPAIPGTWHWENDSRLVFYPDEDWPAGQVFQIHFAKEAFAQDKLMAAFDYSFSTQPFQAKITNFRFNQDPVNPEVREAVATIEFNYPVDTNSFEGNSVLMFQALKNEHIDLNATHFKFTVSYDVNKRTAWLRSESIPLPNEPRFLLLTLDKGVKSSTGTSALSAPINQTILIPDSSSYFKIDKVNASIVRNQKDSPEQVLIIETSLGVTEKAINKGVHLYLLPANYPATANEAEKKDYNWQNPGEITPQILALSTPLNLNPLPTELNYSSLHSYQFSVSKPGYLYLKIDKGLTGFGNFSLKDDYLSVFKAPELPKEITFLHKGALLALTNNEQKLSILVRGLAAVKFNIARVRPNDLNQLVTQTQGDFNNPYFINQSFNQQNISEIYSEVQQFDNSDLAKQNYTTVDFAKYLTTQANTEGPQGLFLLEATGWDAANNQALDIKANRLILITNLGMIVKDNSDGSHDVFVQSITEGSPVENAQLVILGKNGVPLLSRVSDAQGRVSFPNLNDFINEREPTAYMATVGSDVSFIPYNKSGRQLNYSRFDVGGLYTSNQDEHSLSAYLFSDRGIYRPGDTAHIGMIIKQAYAAPQPQGLPLQARIIDSRGTTIATQQLILNATGFLTLDFSTSATSPTGQYTINLYLVKDNNAESLLGSTTVQVAEFQPDRMRISASLIPKQSQGWLSPDDLKATVSLQNLYGAPAAGRIVSGKLLLSPQRAAFSQYPDYQFFDPLIDPANPTKVFTDTLGDQKTDDNGQTEFNFNLSRFTKATYQLSFFAEGFEAEGGRSVTTQTTALVSPLAYLVGYKPDGDLKFIQQNSQRSVQFIAINPKLEQQALDDLKVQLNILRPVTTLVKKPDGTFQYESIIQTSPISTQDFSISNNGVNFPLPTDKIGDFELVILDKDQTELSRFNFAVVGASQLPLPRNAELSVKLNKEEYSPGEDIELQIQGPYAGAGLITIERDRVYASQWFKADTNSSIQKIHIPEDFRGNGYVNVALVRDWNSSDLFISPLSYMVIPFSINHDNQNLGIELKVSEHARPGDELKISYSTNQPAKIIVYAVDEGILQVARYLTPDPLAFFFQKYALEVITQQTLDQILPRFILDRERSAAGGDDSDALLAAHLNPFKRKTDLPVVFWSGLLDSDTNAKEVSYTLPDYFNGRLRIMAVAVSDSALGSAEKYTEVKGYFVINPNTPTFVAPGDEFDLSVSVANGVEGSGANAELKLTLETTAELEILDGASRTLKIAEGAEQTAQFKLKARSLPGSADLSFTATLGDKHSSIDASISVRPASVYSTSVQSGLSQEKQLELTLNSNYFPDLYEAKAGISTSPLILVAGMAHFLEGFPYGCTEQLTSEALPLLAMQNQPWFARDEQALKDKIAMTIQMILQRQMSNGGFSYWPGLGDNSGNRFATVYAMNFLTDAKAQGYDIPQDRFSLGLSYLRDLASGNPANLDEARIQAYAIYILTRNEIITTNYLVNLQLYLNNHYAKEAPKDLTSAFLASSYQLLKSTQEAERLIKGYQLDNKNLLNTDFFTPAVANAEYLYLLSNHFPTLAAQQGQPLVMNLVANINNDNLNTLFSGVSSMALSAYAKFNTAAQGIDLSIVQLINGKEKPAAGSNEPSNYVQVDLDDKATEVRFNNPQSQPFFYQLSQSGFNNQPVTAAIKEGIEITREYRNQQGEVVDEVAIGDEVEVHILVRTLKDQYLNNIAIVDLLPGGFEVNRNSIASDKVDFVDAREDRVIYFTSLDSSAKELVYKIKATNLGDYQVPPVFAESMYNPMLKASSITESIRIIPRS